MSLVLDQVTGGKVLARKSAVSQTLGEDALVGNFLSASQPALRHWGASHPIRPSKPCALGAHSQPSP